MGDCDLAIKSPNFLLCFKNKSKITNIGVERELTGER